MSDGRRIIVQLERGKDTQEISAIFDPLWKSWEDMASGYSDKEIAFLHKVFERSNAISRRVIAGLQEAPAGKGKVYSAPLGDLRSARLVVSSGVSMLTLKADVGTSDLYRARFEGPLPEVRAKEGVVSIRYPRSLWAVGKAKRIAEVALSPAIPWRIAIQGGASGVIADLRNLKFAGLEAKGGASMIHLELPPPSGTVPVRISGGASEILIRRPAGVPARVHLKGWASTFIFDDELFSNMGNDVRMQSPGFDAAAPHYEIEVLSSASMVTISTR